MILLITVIFFPLLVQGASSPQETITQKDQKELLEKEFGVLKKTLGQLDQQLKTIEKKMKNSPLGKEPQEVIKKTWQYSFHKILEHILHRLEKTLWGLQTLVQHGLPIPHHFPYGPFFFLPLLLVSLISLLSLLLGSRLVLRQKKQWSHYPQPSLFFSMSKGSFLSSFSWFSFFFKKSPKKKHQKLWSFLSVFKSLFFQDLEEHLPHAKDNHDFSYIEKENKEDANPQSPSFFKENNLSPKDEDPQEYNSSSISHEGKQEKNIPEEKQGTTQEMPTKEEKKEKKVIFHQHFSLPLGPLVHGWIAGRLGIVSALLFCPSLLYFFLSLVLGRILFLGGLVDKSFLFLGYGALFPFYTYVFWASWQWLNLVTFEGLLLLPQRSSEVLLYGRLSILVGFSGALVLTMLDILSTQGPGKGPILTALKDIFFLLSLFLLYKMFKSIPRESGLSSSDFSDKKKNFLGSFFGALSQGVFGALIFWILFPEKLFSIAIPLFLTAFIFLLWVPLQRWFTYYPLFFSRYLSHHYFFKKTTFWRKKNFPLRATQLCVSFFLGVLWSCYLWWNNHQPVYDFFFSTLSMMMASVFFQRFFHSLVVIVLAVFLVKGADRVLKYYVEDKQSADSLENNFFAVRLKTLMSMLKTLVRVVIWLPAITLVLSQFENLNFTTFITGITAASVGLTFGIQNIVRDFITGFFIILENNLMVGDEVDIDQRIGKVEAITLRTLKIRGDNGTLLTIPFGSITVIGNRNRVFSAVVLNISVGYHEDLDKVQQLIERAFFMTKRLPVVGRKISGSLELRGINEVTSFSVVFQGKIMTAPNSQDMVRRAFNRQLKKLFDENNIVVPMPPYNPQRAIPSLTQTQI